jgi:hypothetical protein
MIRKVNIKEIKPNDSNPRYITESDFKRLIKSIKDFPEMLEVKPLIVNKNMVVIGGNQRLEALKSLGHFEVQVQQVNWSVEKQKEFTIKDNTHYGSWDYDALGNNWQYDELQQWGLNVWNPDEDYFDVDDEDEKEIKPSATDDDHSNFEIVLEYENKKKLIKVLNEVKDKYNLEKQEEALMLIINKFQEHDRK